MRLRDSAGAWVAVTWRDIESASIAVLEDQSPVSIATLTVLLALGRMKPRRGQDDARTYLDQALQLTRVHHRVGTVRPAWPALAGAAWLAGDEQAVLEMAPSGSDRRH